MLTRGAPFLWREFSNFSKCYEEFLFGVPISYVQQPRAPIDAMFLRNFRQHVRENVYLSAVAPDLSLADTLRILIIEKDMSSSEHRSGLANVDELAGAISAAFPGSQVRRIRLSRVSVADQISLLGESHAVIVQAGSDTMVLPFMSDKSIAFVFGRVMHKPQTIAWTPTNITVTTPSIELYLMEYVPGIQIVSVTKMGRTFSTPDATLVEIDVASFMVALSEKINKMCYSSARRNDYCASI